MALKVELKPNERIIIGTVVIKNSDSRSRFFVEGHAPILREKDFLTPRTADTPAKLIYLAVQLMYLDGTVDNQKDTYFNLVQDILDAAPSTAQFVAEVNNTHLKWRLLQSVEGSQRPDRLRETSARQCKTQRQAYSKTHQQTASPRSLMRRFCCALRSASSRSATAGRSEGGRA